MSGGETNMTIIENKIIHYCMIAYYKCMIFIAHVRLARERAKGENLRKYIEKLNKKRDIR